MKIEMKKEFEKDYITREAGERLRMSILGAYKKGEILELDFSGMTIASTSFFDESIAKLAKEGLTKKEFEKIVRLKGLNPRDQKLLDDLCRYRGFV